MGLRPPKINKHKTQKKRTSGPKNSVRKRQIFEHNTKSLMNLRPQDYMNLRPQTKIVNPRLQKSCEPKANHAACSPNASGGAQRLPPPPQPPSSCFFFPNASCRRRGVVNSLPLGGTFALRSNPYLQSVKSGGSLARNARFGASNSQNVRSFSCFACLAVCQCKRVVRGRRSTL